MTSSGSAPIYPLIRLGELARAHGLDAAETSDWVSARAAARFAGVKTYMLAYWALQELVTVKRHRPNSERWYLREEELGKAHGLDVTRQTLGDWADRRLITFKRAHGAANRSYLRQEMEIVRALSREGRPTRYIAVLVHTNLVLSAKDDAPRKALPMTMTDTPTGTDEAMGGPESLQPLKPENPWYTSTPRAMAEVVMTTYRQFLTTHGITTTRVGVINSFAAEVAAPALVGLPEQPADDALRIAREIVADAYAKAMEAFGVWLWVRNAVEARVLTEVKETIAEHVRLRTEGPFRAVEGASGDEDAKESAGEVKGETADDGGVQLPAEGEATADEAAGEDSPGG